MFIFNILYFIIALGVIVLVHELGHLIVAKSNGVYCHEFSIGMGPLLVNLGKDKTGTKYSIRMIPIGGYVMLAGEDNDQEQDKSIAPDMLLNNKSPFVRFKVLIAGSTMNFILPLVLLLFIGFFGGVTDSSTQIDVIDNYPASISGIENGSYITAINDHATEDYDSLVDVLSSIEGEQVVVSYTYDDISYKIDVRLDNGMLGITQHRVKFKLFASIKYAIITTLKLILSIIMTLYILFTGQASVNDLSGPIGIYTMSSQVLSFGLLSSLMWINYLSVNIGFMNLLPIPALDGGRLVFVIYEMITKKPVNKKVEETFLMIGVLFLLSLFILVSFNDIIRVLN